ncbi:MAG: hypothetical protein LBD24_08385 [Spirochaetaceae bacterium]|nr:hypothetical protein [Spirochaetaceae bacterium]
MHHFETTVLCLRRRRRTRCCTTLKQQAAMFETVGDGPEAAAGLPTP